jgi:hypothetical protein
MALTFALLSVDGRLPFSGISRNRVVARGQWEQAVVFAVSGSR